MLNDQETMDRLAEIRSRLEKATRGPWAAGDRPISRDSVLQVLTGGSGPNGLTREVCEVGQAGETCPPGICVVNTHLDLKTGERTEAVDNAVFVAHAWSDIEWLLDLVEGAAR